MEPFEVWGARQIAELQAAIRGVGAGRRGVRGAVGVLGRAVRREPRGGDRRRQVDARAREIGLLFPHYAAGADRDAGLDAVDAIGLWWWWVGQQGVESRA